MEIRPRITVDEGEIRVDGKMESTFITKLLSHQIADAQKARPGATHKAGRVLFDDAEAALINDELKAYKERNLPHLTRLIELSTAIADANEENYRILCERVESDFCKEQEVNVDGLQDEYDALITDRVAFYLKMLTQAKRSSHLISAGCDKIMSKLENGADLELCKKEYEAI